ncbi:DUF1707 SHOCT-like domain-containing protein [Nocardiopsis dassonvillei]|uniref:DUF1707 domain-containing protein n=1 Tax=Nocardiopsis dassonvillei (strain ATCC 23218 / DSM 43111 / CIP 107115 / JCM 7437 / KCTC 9190 / NBRC 14626 / NCTC 10488 / NRRL B-5397 / IMRU 509) TaxID=446468 RepID=D7B307_NOCDD|nr:DUF1707 domain-containing protein [Nocardiopsis dassonvillei]ADH68697.1 protein of unknown function DUF1707 [Nocardiopsis dassonvillei subsp. dassonvillei DSM 43111]APC36759.1 hypothetical protein A9R04_19685 [Nocardiopsis dassonvillei]NKY80510.1 DUF1707 domain-containing protein [Nocardiopsis dassonvillei]VEI89206.1 Domain of uncharacterised function (DUF1707) [Nocardiopsis dassonvillei]
MEDERLPLHRMRASDAERDLTVDRLTTAFVEGRLDHEEYDRRVGLALGAVLLGDLRPLTADLPASPSAVHGVPGARQGADPLSDPLSGSARADPGSGRDRRDGREPPDADDLSLLGAPWGEWGDEWRWWTGVAVILTSVWGVVSLMGGELVPYWPLVPLGIWAAVLLASAIWPSEGEPP